MKRLFIYIINLYQKISCLKPRVCRFFPSCSEYTKQAIQQYGIKRGLFLGIKRISRCHPFYPGGYDPVETRRVNIPTTGIDDIERG